jgi:N-acyl-phosphatidylethanolamine-hydrolysing phospholipase D
MNGKTVFKWLGGATWVLDFEGICIASDPCLCPTGTVQDYFWFKSRREKGPVFINGDFEGVNLWLLTHNHEDHIDSIGLSVISDTSSVIAHKSLREYLRTGQLTKCSFLDWHEMTTITAKTFEITVRAVPAIHGRNPIVAYFAGSGNGYLVKINNLITGSYFSFYQTGDGVLTSKSIRAIRNEKVDLFIPNVGKAMIAIPVAEDLLGPLTLDIADAISFARQFHPKKIIPVHFDTFSHYKESMTNCQVRDSRLIIPKHGEQIEL